MKNRLTNGLVAPSWKTYYTRYVFSGTFSISSISMWINNDTVIYSGTGYYMRYNSHDGIYVDNDELINKELVESDEDGYYHFEADKYYLFVNSREIDSSSSTPPSSSSLIYTYLRKCINNCTAQAIVTSSTTTPVRIVTDMSTSFRFYLNAAGNPISQKTTDVIVHDMAITHTYLPEDTSDSHYGWLFYATKVGNFSESDIYYDSDIFGGVNYNKNMNNASGDFLGSVICSSLSFKSRRNSTNIATYPYWVYEVKYEDEDDWILLGYFIKTKDEKDVNGFFTLTFRDALNFVDDNAHEFLNIAYNTDYQSASLYTYEKYLGNSVDVTPFTVDIVESYGVIWASGGYKALFIDDDNVQRLKAPVYSLMRKSTYKRIDWDLTSVTNLFVPTSSSTAVNLTVSSRLDDNSALKDGLIRMENPTTVTLNPWGNWQSTWNSSVSHKFFQISGDNNIYYAIGDTSDSGCSMSSSGLSIAYANKANHVSVTDLSSYIYPVMNNQSVESSVVTEYVGVDLLGIGAPGILNLSIWYNDNFYSVSNKEEISNGIRFTLNKRNYLSLTGTIGGTLSSHPHNGWESNYYYKIVAAPTITTVADLIDRICEWNGVTNGISGYAFLSEQIENKFNSPSTTFRELLKDIAQLCGGYICMDSNNRVVLRTLVTKQYPFSDENVYSSWKGLSHSPFELIRVNVEGEQSYMTFGGGGRLQLTITNDFCKVIDKYDFSNKYLSQLFNGYYNLGNWEEVEITTWSDFGLDVGDILEATDNTPRTVILSKSITSKGVRLSSAIV